MRMTLAFQCCVGHLTASVLLHKSSASETGVQTTKHPLPHYAVWPIHQQQTLPAVQGTIFTKPLVTPADAYMQVSRDHTKYAKALSLLLKVQPAGQQQ